MTRLEAHEIVDLGITLIPEGRQLFPEMTVRENLLMGAYRRAARDRQNQTLEEMMNLFPRVKERLEQNAGSLSGGEQQMVAIARGMMARPKLLMFDEPSLGLAPIIVSQVFEVIDTIVKTGIITGNLCSAATLRAHPGELVLFEVPKTYIPTYPAPPLPPPPHSDENPHQPQSN